MKLKKSEIELIVLKRLQESADEYGLESRYENLMSLVDNESITEVDLHNVVLTLNNKGYVKTKTLNIPMASAHAQMYLTVSGAEYLMNIENPESREVSVMLRLSELELSMLKAFAEVSEERRGVFTPVYLLSISRNSDVTENNLEEAFDMLVECMLINTISSENASSYNSVGGCITNKGKQYLRQLEASNQPTDNVVGVSNFTTNFYAPSQIGSIGDGNTVSINITDSFNVLRALAASNDEAKEIISEMEDETNCKHPSLDKILTLGKNLLSLLGDGAKQIIVQIMVSIISKYIGM